VSTSEPRISVVIPVRGGGDAFKQCLAAVVASTLAPHELIVVADGETDNSAAVAESYGAKVIRLPVSIGPAKARNIGAQAASGEILFFVDADVVIKPESVGLVREFFQDYQDIAAIFGSYDEQPGAANFLSQYKNLYHHFIHQMANEEASTFWSGCGAMRRDIFLALGGFDERFEKPSIEDIELGYRLRRAGYEIRVCKQLQCKHLKEWRIGSLLKADFFYRALPWTQLILRDGKLPNDLNLRVSQRVSMLSAYGILLSVGIAILQPLALLLAVVCFLLLFGLNVPLYRFFYRQRGLLFMSKAVFWQWLYYIYSGIAFVVGVIRYPFDKRESCRCN